MGREPTVFRRCHPCVSVGSLLVLVFGIRDLSVETGLVRAMLDVLPFHKTLDAFLVP
jgi:hypothetical protein